MNYKVVENILSNIYQFAFDNKITSLDVFLITLSFIFFGAIFCGIVSLIILLKMSFITVNKKIK